MVSAVSHKVLAAKELAYGMLRNVIWLPGFPYKLRNTGFPGLTNCIPITTHSLSSAVQSRGPQRPIRGVKVNVIISRILFLFVNWWHESGYLLIHTTGNWINTRKSKKRKNIVAVRPGRKATSGNPISFLLTCCITKAWIPKLLGTNLKIRKFK